MADPALLFSGSPPGEGGLSPERAAAITSWIESANPRFYRNVSQSSTERAKLWEAMLPGIHLARFEPHERMLTQGAPVERVLVLVSGGATSYANYVLEEGEQASLDADADLGEVAAELSAGDTCGFEGVVTGDIADRRERRSVVAGPFPVVAVSIPRIASRMVSEQAVTSYRQRVQFLNQLWVLREFPEACRAALARGASELVFESRDPQVLFEAQQDATQCYMVMSGTVVLEFPTAGAPGGATQYEEVGRLGIVGCECLEPTRARWHSSAKASPGAHVLVLAASAMREQVEQATKALGPEAARNLETYAQAKAEWRAAAQRFLSSATGVSVQSVADFQASTVPCSLCGTKGHGAKTCRHGSPKPLASPAGSAGGRKAKKPAPPQRSATMGAARAQRAVASTLTALSVGEPAEGAAGGRALPGLKRHPTTSSLVRSPPSPSSPRHVRFRDNNISVALPAEGAAAGAEPLSPRSPLIPKGARGLSPRGPSPRASSRQLTALELVCGVVSPSSSASTSPKSSSATSSPPPLSATARR